MSRQTSVTPTDWELFLLKILWAHGRQTVEKIREVMRIKGYKRSDSAVRTILRIMIKKGLVHTYVIDKVTHYEAAVARKEVETKVLRHVINTLFDRDQRGFVKRALEETHSNTDALNQVHAILEGR